jgi:hypothetical protein
VNLLAIPIVGAITGALIEKERPAAGAVGGGIAGGIILMFIVAVRSAPKSSS